MITGWCCPIVVRQPVALWSGRPAVVQLTRMTGNRPAVSLRWDERAPIIWACRANLLLSHVTVCLLAAGVMMITAVVLTHRAGQPGTQRTVITPAASRAFRGRDRSGLPPLPHAPHRRVPAEPGGRSRQRRRAIRDPFRHTGDQRADAVLHAARVPDRARIPEVAAVREGGVARLPARIFARPPPHRIHDAQNHRDDGTEAFAVRQSIAGCPAPRASDAAARAPHHDAVATKVDHFKIAMCP
jgi:hypothetical protein